MGPLLAAGMISALPAARVSTLVATLLAVPRADIFEISSNVLDEARISTAAVVLVVVLSFVPNVSRLVAVLREMRHGKWCDRWTSLIDDSTSGHIHLARENLRLVIARTGENSWIRPLDQTPGRRI